jgi:hypothetical protein
VAWRIRRLDRAHDKVTVTAPLALSASVDTIW